MKCLCSLCLFNSMRTPAPDVMNGGFVLALPKLQLPALISVSVVSHHWILINKLNYFFSLMMFSHFAHQAGRSHGEERVHAKDEIAREKIKETVLLSGIWPHRSILLYFLIRENDSVLLYFTGLPMLPLGNGVKKHLHKQSIPGSITYNCVCVCVRVCNTNRVHTGGRYLVGSPKF